jgi:hypothetical protein
VASNDPVSVGLKDTLIRHRPSGGSALPLQESSTIANGESSEEIDAPWMLTVAPVSLWTFTLRVREDPIWTSPKFSSSGRISSSPLGVGVGVASTAGVGVGVDVATTAAGVGVGVAATPVGVGVSVAAGAGVGVAATLVGVGVSVATGAGVGVAAAIVGVGGAVAAGVGVAVAGTAVGVGVAVGAGVGVAVGAGVGVGVADGVAVGAAGITTPKLAEALTGGDIAAVTVLHVPALGLNNSAGTGEQVPVPLAVQQARGMPLPVQIALVPFLSQAPWSSQVPVLVPVQQGKGVPAPVQPISQADPLQFGFGHKVAPAMRQSLLKQSSPPASRMSPALGPTESWAIVKTLPPRGSLRLPVGVKAPVAPLAGSYRSAVPTLFWISEVMLPMPLTLIPPATSTLPASGPLVNSEME